MSNATTTRTNETMYTTIKEAFSAGQGDVFFTKNGKYIAKCGKDNLDFYFDNGYTYLTFDQVMQISKQQREQNIVEPQLDRNYKPHITSIQCVQTSSKCEQFYGEFPDAYGQYL